MSIVGMDFGTTNSGMAAYDGRQLRFIPIDPSNQTASVARTALYITNDRQVYIGRGAIDTYYAQNLNRPASIERVRVGEITLTFAELPSFIRDVYIDKDVLSPGRLFLSFKTVLSSLNYLGTVVGSHFYFLEDIIALYLYIAKQRAETFLGTEINQIVLGRPVRFAFDPQDDLLARERLLKAAFRAGYETVYLQYEPVAAAYHYESTIHDEQNVLIFDFGGGTLDISVMKVGSARGQTVLANGGVPIAGDVFDQKLVRAHLPKHFGEGSYYRSGGKRLPVPTSYYEAFSNWQDMLSLQKPGMLEAIEQIERASEKPRQIRALRHLISSSYGLKMYDTVEAVKQQLSSVERAAIRLDGEKFDVYEPVTRTDFERAIRPEIEVIDTYLDTLMNEAGLSNVDINRVIRTGGSSQIPAFIELLERRFGEAKVGSIDMFSSVTSGLGIIAHGIELGEIQAEAHHRQDYDLSDHVDNSAQNGIPAIDFDTMKKFVALVEPVNSAEPASSALVGLTYDYQVAAVTYPRDTMFATTNLALLGMPEADYLMLLSASPDDLILLCTSEYRFFSKTVNQLVRLNEVGLDLADAEGFQVDVFGDEYLSGLTRWDASRSSDLGLLVTTSGYFRTFKAEPLIARLGQSVPYQPPRLKGDPLTLILASDRDELLAFTSNGRAVSVRGDILNQQIEGRLLTIPTNERLIAAYSVTTPQKFILASENGTMVVIDSNDVPVAGLNSSGTKIFAAPHLKCVLSWSDDYPVWVVTSHRLLPLDSDIIANSASQAPFKPLKFSKDETLVGLISFP